MPFARATFGSTAEGIFVVSTSSVVTSHRSDVVRPRLGILLDVVVAVIAFAGSLAQLSHGGIVATSGESEGLSLLSVILAACSTAPLIVWRRFPLGVFVTTALASVLLAGFGSPIGLLLGPTIAFYLLAASRERENPWTRRTTAIGVGLFLAYLGATAAAQEAFPGLEILHTGLAAAVAWFAGERTRLGREQLLELEERAMNAERAAERERRLAAAEERSRIARDLHDSAGHAINVIAVRAGAARIRHHQNPDRSLAALEVIEEVARQTAGEIDQIVGGLRDGQSGTEMVDVPPGLASLDTLIAHHSAAGLDITVDVSGARRPLGVAADQSVYRILQEALTNSARHGNGRARIALAFGSTALVLCVVNSVPLEASPRPGGGHGLIGMRERANLLGGRLDIEQSNEIFRVRAMIPYGLQSS